MKFEISSEDYRKIHEWWDKVVKPAALKLQEERRKEDPNFRPFAEDGEVYYGAIGGGMTYSFTPTGLGTVVKVKEAITGLELDLTEYDHW